MKKYEKVFQKDYETWYGENEAYRKQVAEDPDRLAFHLMPETGWMNDPNGLCQFKGEYHIYYQYTPFEPTGELKLWGHYKTKDLVTYEQCQPVLFRTAMRMLMAYIPALLSVKMGRSTSFIQEM